MSYSLEDWAHFLRRETASVLIARHESQVEYWLETQIFGGLNAQIIRNENELSTKPARLTNLKVNQVGFDTETASVGP